MITNVYRMLLPLSIRRILSRYGSKKMMMTISFKFLSTSYSLFHFCCFPFFHFLPHLHHNFLQIKIPLLFFSKNAEKKRKKNPENIFSKSRRFQYSRFVSPQVSSLVRGVQLLFAEILRSSFILRVQLLYRRPTNFGQRAAPESGSPTQAHTRSPGRKLTLTQPSPRPSRNLPPPNEALVYGVAKPQTASEMRAHKS